MVRRWGRTWFDVMERVRSRSSTSCLKVGLWDGTACQQSLIIMYLNEEWEKEKGDEKKRGKKPHTSIQRNAFSGTFHLQTRKCSQFVGACGGTVHAVALFQKFEQLLDRDTGIWRTTQSKDLPEQHSKRPPRPERGRQDNIINISLLCQVCVINSTKL